MVIGTIDPGKDDANPTNPGPFNAVNLLAKNVSPVNILLKARPKQPVDVVICMLPLIQTMDPLSVIMDSPLIVYLIKRSLSLANQLLNFYYIRQNPPHLLALV